MNSHLYHDDDRSTAFSTAGTSLAAILIGTYACYTAAGLLGFPVAFWLHRLVATLHRFANMAAAQLPLLLPAPPSPSNSDDTAQDDRPTSPLSMLSSASAFVSKGVGKVTGALKNYRNVPAGLGNWDNSCFQNSVMQGLASLPALRQYLSKTTSEYSTLDADTTNGALLDLITKLNDPEKHGQTFWIRGVLKSMNTFQQQDAQEYYSKILDALDKEVKKASKRKRRSSVSLLSVMKSLTDSDDAAANKDESEQRTEESSSNSEATQQPTVAPNPLDGLLAQRVGCVTCGYTEGLSLISFNCLTVPLGRYGAADVRDCLDEYTHLEYIEGVECAKCTLLKREKVIAGLAGIDERFAEELKTIRDALQDEDFDDKTVVTKFNMPKKRWEQTTKSRQAVIARAPKSLVIHINRSIFDEMTGDQLKNNAPVYYPRVLDLGRWCLGSRPSDSHEKDEEVDELWPRDPKESMIRDSNSAQDPAASPSPFQYALKAVVTHFGAHGYGHYVCYRQHPFSTADKTDEADKSEEATEEDVEKSEREDPKHQTSEDQWWRISDDSVYEVSEDEATRQQNVFMLFYERIDADSAPTDTEPARPAQATSSKLDGGAQKAAISAMSLIDPALLSEVDAKDADDSVPELSPDSGMATPPCSAPRTPTHPLLSSTPVVAADEQKQLLTPPREFGDADVDMTEASETADDDNDDESDGAPSTNLTSDDDFEMADRAQPVKAPEPSATAPSRQGTAPSPSFSQPRVMRTAGEAGAAGSEGDRNALPMVAAT